MSANDSKRFYWLKLNEKFFKSHEAIIIEGMPNGKEYMLFYLKLLCESVSHEGSLRFSEAIPYDENMLSSLTNTNVDVVRSAIKVLESCKMIEIQDDGTYFMTKVREMIGSETGSTIRSREYRKNSDSSHNRLQVGCKQVASRLQCSQETRDKSIEYRDKSIDSSCYNNKLKISNNKGFANAEEKIQNHFKRLLNPKELEKIQYWFSTYNNSDGFIDACIDYSISKNCKSIEYIDTVLINEATRKNNKDLRSNDDVINEDDYEDVI